MGCEGCKETVDNENRDSRASKDFVTGGALRRARQGHKDKGLRCRTRALQLAEEFEGEIIHLNSWNKAL